MARPRPCLLWLPALWPTSRAAGLGAGCFRAKTGSLRPQSGGLRRASKCLRPASEGLRPTSECLGPASGRLRPASEGLRRASEAENSAFQRVICADLPPRSRVHLPGFDVQKPFLAVPGPIFDLGWPRMTCHQPGSGVDRLKRQMRPSNGQDFPPTGVLAGPLYLVSGLCVQWNVPSCRVGVTSFPQHALKWEN